MMIKNLMLSTLIFFIALPVLLQIQLSHFLLKKKVFPKQKYDQFVRK